MSAEGCPEPIRNRRGSESGIFGLQRASGSRRLVRPDFGREAGRSGEAVSLPRSSALRLNGSEAQQRQPMRMSLSGHAESARGVSPRAAHRSGRDTLASSGSCHRNEGCRLPPKIGARPVASWLPPDVGDLPPLLHGHYPASSLLRSSPPLTGASVLSASRFRPLAPFPLASSARFSSSVRKPE